MYALVFALALVLAGCSKDTPIAPAPKVNPGADDITRPPGLFPDPGELPVEGLNMVGQPDKYDIASDVLLNSILGNEKQDLALARALDGIDVLISGVVEIDGKEQLYLGIDEETFAKHDIENLQSVLEARFPDIPIYIEKSEGVILLSDTDEDDEPVIDIFSDNFNDLTAWTADDSWETGVFANPVPDEEEDNKVASISSANCTGTCTITTEPLDLSGYSSVTISLHRWLEDTFAAGGRVAIEVGNDDVYRTVASWDSNDGDGVWHYNTFTLDEQDLGESTTIRISVTMNSFSSFFSMFFGTSETEDYTAAVDNILIQGTEAVEIPDIPNLTVHSVSASPERVDSGASVRVQYSVRNNGTAHASREAVSIYRHTTETDDPATGGIKVNTFTMPTPLAPDAGFSRSAVTRVPSVSEDTTVYYYVCVNTAENEVQTDDNCSGPVIVTVRARVAETSEPETPFEIPPTIGETTETPVNDYTETAYPAPPYEGCRHSPKRNHAMGGDVMLPYYLSEGRDSSSSSTPNSCGGITLGGLETEDGTKGFVVSNHVVTEDDSMSSLTNTDVVVGHGKYYETFDIGRLLGKVYRTSEIIVDSDGDNVRIADASFVAYPRPETPDCSLTWDSYGTIFCLDLNGNGDQVERVAPLRIRGKGEEVYTVTGSQQPAKGLKLWLTVSGPQILDHFRCELAGSRRADSLGLGQIHRVFYIRDYYGVVAGCTGADSPRRRRGLRRSKRRFLA